MSLRAFYEQYKYHIWGVAAVLVILLTGLLITLYFFYRTKRLKDELELLASYILEGRDPAENEMLEKHADWVKEFLPKYGGYQ